MTIVDANLLLYAYNADAPRHPAASAWLTELIRSGETVALPWITLWAFIRISSNSRIYANPRPAQETFAIIRELLEQPEVFVMEPGPRHAGILENLVAKHGITGALVTDAVFAAMAIENGATLASTDQNFRRFPGLRWIDPLGESIT